jgi:hypothetical protein
MVRFVLTVSVLSSVIVAGDEPEPSETEPEFTFLRLVYSGTGWRGSSWAVDYPKADLQFLYALQKLSDFTFVGTTNKALPLSDPEIFRYPFIYAVEVGHLFFSDQEAVQLREYLERGGFLVVDDFHGPAEWHYFYQQIKKVFPEYEPVELPADHPIFHCYYDIDNLIQVPGYHSVRSGRTWEKGGYEAKYMGIENEEGRLMVMINHNVDLGDAWEWAEQEAYPREYATLAFQLGINYIIYAMTH